MTMGPSDPVQCETAALAPYCTALLQTSGRTPCRATLDLSCASVCLLINQMEEMLLQKEQDPDSFTPLAEPG